MPPINVSGLRLEWETLKAELRSIPPERIPALDRLDSREDSGEIGALDGPMNGGGILF
jgi:hypothetical protein